MSQQIKPFFINSNIILPGNVIETCDDFLDAVGGNTGNSYITFLKQINCELNTTCDTIPALLQCDFFREQS